MSAAAISLRDVWKYFGDFPAVRGVSLEIPEGVILALLGRNGAGKTTLLRVMGGLLRPSKGEVSVGDARDRRASIGMVGHGEWIYDDLTAEENLQFFAQLYNVDDAAAKISSWLDTVGLSRFRRSRAGEFSRGMRQRLSIARALLHDPKILLLDEPWTALDDRAVDLLSSLLLDARKQRRTVVVCSHQLREALHIATELAVIDRGRLIFTGPNTDELKSSPEQFYQKIS